ncbi:MAG: YesL family protein [Dorea sp.]|nr:YesL family protein [Dorea sp.]
MNKLFSPDNPVMEFINKLVASVLVNILWFICSLPIITIGPSTTALFYCSQKLARDEGSHITSAFFRSFKLNFKQSTIVGLILTFVSAALVFDGFVLRKLYRTSAFWAILTAVFLVAVVAVIIISMWIYPLMARFENSIMAMFKNSIMLGMRFFLCTLIMFGIYFIMGFLVINIMTPLIIFGFGTCAFFCSLLQKNILIMLEGPDPEDEIIEDVIEEVEM